MATTMRAEDLVLEEPQSPTEKFMASLWSEIIGLKNVSRSDKFLDVGGNSLTLNIVINRIKLERGVSIAPQLFFDPDKSSITDLARELDELVANAARPERTVLVSDST